jgi:hypothetical protein
MLLRLLLLCVLFCSCNSQRMIQTDLYFGQLKLDGSMVSEKQWSDFIEKHISKIFTQGSTIIKANGNWLDTSQKKIVTEPSFLVITINKLTPKLNRQIDSLRSTYKRLYDQQSVLRVDKKVKAKF